MAFQIEDGTGTGSRAKVVDNLLRTYTVSEEEVSHESEEHGNTFSWVNISYDYAAADTILWVRNDNSALRLQIWGVALWSDTATEVIGHFPMDTTPAGTVVTGVNLNAISGLDALATAYADETGNAQGAIWGRFRIPAGIQIFQNLSGAIILGLNDEIAFDFVTDGAACLVEVIGYYHAL